MRDSMVPTFNYIPLLPLLHPYPPASLPLPNPWRSKRRRRRSRRGALRLWTQPAMGVWGGVGGMWGELD